MQIKFHSIKKTEIVIFKSKQKKFEGYLKIKLCGKRLYPTKLNRVNALLFKMRKNVSLKILRSIHFVIFDSYLSYCLSSEL